MYNMDMISCQRSRIKLKAKSIVKILVCKYESTFSAHIDKVMKRATRLIAIINHIGHIIRQNKWRPVSFNCTYKLLRMAERLVEVNVKQVTLTTDHDIVIVSIAQAQYISGDTVAGRGSRKIVD